MKQMVFGFLLLFGLSISCYAESVALPNHPRQDLVRFCHDCSLNCRSLPLTRIRGDVFKTPIVVMASPPLKGVVTRISPRDTFDPYLPLITWFEGFRDDRIITSPALLRQLISLDMQMDLHALIEIAVQRKVGDPVCRQSGARIMDLVMHQTNRAGDWLNAVVSFQELEYQKRRMQKSANDLQNQIDRIRQTGEFLR